MKLALVLISGLMAANVALAGDRCLVNASADARLAAATTHYLNVETALLQQAKEANEASLAQQIEAGKKTPANRANRGVVEALNRNSTEIQRINAQLAAAYAEYLAIYNSLTVECGR